MPDAVNLICKFNSDRTILKEVLRVGKVHQVLKLWRDRQVYPDSFMAGMIETVEKTIQDKRKDKRDEMPQVNFDIEDLYGFAHNKKHLEMWSEKSSELRTQLDIMFKNSMLMVKQKSRSLRLSS